MLHLSPLPSAHRQRHEILRLYCHALFSLSFWREIGERLLDINNKKNKGNEENFNHRGSSDVCVVAMFAQKDAIMGVGNGVKLTGLMEMFWETTDAEGMMPAEKGSRWHLETDKNDNINFWIDVPSHGQEKLHETTWKRLNASLFLTITHEM